MPPNNTVTVIVRLIKGEAAVTEKRFDSTFIIGRGKECGFQVMETCVSRNHLQVVLEHDQWRIRDLDSANGTFLNGIRVGEAPLTDAMEIELGKGGAILSLEVETAEPAKVEPVASASGDIATETQIIRHYFEKEPEESVGEQTMMFRRAFARVQKKKSRKYKVIIGAVLFLLIASGSVIVYQMNKLNTLRKTAENIFYTNKSFELQISKMEEIVLLNADPKQVAEIKAKRLKLKDREKEYEDFVKELGVYQKAPEDEQAILRVARIFGECDANVPKGFVIEVKRYIQMWKKTDRLEKALQRANEKGYTPLITRVMTDNNLPPQYFFLALQESNFNERAVGPPTRYGHAKGMWQFIALTGHKYGLQIGSMQDTPDYDPADERFDSVKSTMAAMRYLKDLNNTEGQASGLLVMASYNWGENNIRQIIARMPENPRDRNFWRLLSYKDIPRETYDYVFSIFSAAVICENPRLFGVNVECPVLSKKEK